MQLSTVLLSASLLVSSVLGAPAVFQSEAETMLRRQWEATDWANIMIGRDAPASASILEKRIVYNPKITSPTSETVWTAGSTQTVTWDASDIPAEAAEYTGTIKLGYLPADGSGGENLKWTLAKDFPIAAGETQVTLPSDLEERQDYIVVVMGDSGNASPKFTITKAPEAIQDLGEQIKHQIHNAIVNDFADA